MSRHAAEVAWQSDGAFASGRYSRRHELRFDGGAVVTGSSSPDVVPAPMSDPAGVDPEEALVAAVAACHMLWFLDLARRAGLDVASYRDRAEGEMGRIDGGRMAVARVTLRPAIAFAGAPPAAAELDRLHHEAHEHCFIANSLKCEVVVEAAAGPAPGWEPWPVPDRTLTAIAAATAKARDAIDFLRAEAQGPSFDAKYAQSSLDQLIAEAYRKDGAPKS